MLSDLSEYKVKKWFISNAITFMCLLRFLWWRFKLSNPSRGSILQLWNDVEWRIYNSKRKYGLFWEIHFKVYSKHFFFRFTKLMIRTVLWLKLMRKARFQSNRMNAPVTHMKLSYHRQIMMKEVSKWDLCVLVTPKTMRKITKNASCEFYLVTLILMSTEGLNSIHTFWWI